jgi:flagellar hook-associated protein 2
MSTSPVSAASTSSTSTPTVTPLTFSGSSTYSADFQTIIDKYVSTQSIQLNQLQSQQTTDQNQLSAVTTLNTDLNNLQDAVDSLATAIGADSFAGSVSNSSQASVTVGDDAAAGSYSLEIDSLGATTQTVSTAGQTVTNPGTGSISTASSFTLSINGTNTTITPAGDTLDDLADAINAAGLSVSANIVNVGSTSSPDYRLSVQSTTLADDTIQLTDSSNTPYLSSIGAPGSPATYKVDGLSNEISSDSSTITLSPGVSVNLLAQTQTGSPVTVTVQQTSSAAATALSNFATAYNQVVTALDAQHGINAGALSGDSTLLSAEQVMQSIGLYTDGNGNSLTNIGLDLDAAGNLTFNSTEFEANLGGNIQTLSQFLGNSTQGFIGNASNAIDSLNDPETGILTDESNILNSAITGLGRSITDQVTLINTNQQALFQQLATSDAAIYAMSQQVTYFQDLFFPNANASTS